MTRSDRVTEPLARRVRRSIPRGDAGRLGSGPALGPPDSSSSGVLILVVELGAQQGAQARRAGVLALAGLLQALHAFLSVGVVLGLDRQLDRTRLAVDVDDDRRDLVAFLQHVASVFDAVAADLGRAQVARDVGVELDLGAARVDGDHLAGDRRAAVVDRRVGGERIAVELLDAERDALAVDVDGQHDRLDLLTLLVVAHGGFAGLVPREVGKVHEAVDAGREADEHAEVGDRLDRALDAVAALHRRGKLLPRIGLALLHAERDAALVLVDLEDHDLDFLAERDHLRRGDVLVGPVHLRDVDQAFDARLDLDERAVVGDVGDLAEQACAVRIAARHAVPRVVAELLQAQRDAVLLGVELQHLGSELLADLNDFARVTHAAPRHVGDVQQAVDAAEVDEGSVLGDVLDHAVHDRPFGQRAEQLGALFAHRSLDYSAARQHDVVALAVELDDLELHRLALERAHVLDRTRVEQRAGQEGADAVDEDGEAALDLAVDGAGDELARLERVLEREPRGEALGLVTREDRVAIAVLDRVDRDRDEIAGLHFELALVVLEFVDRNVGLGLEAGVDDDEAVLDADDLGGDDFTTAHLRLLERVLEHGGERIRRVGFRRARGDLSL